MTGPAPQRHAAIETAWVIDRYLLFDERDGVVHELSPSASAVWELADGKHSALRIAEVLSSRVGQDVSSDVQEALADFRRLRLLSEGPGDRA